MAVPRYPEQPCPKGCPTGIEAVNPPGRSDEDLLGQFLGQVSVAPERDAESVNCIEVPLE
jgi:hypothetical protein